MFTMSQAFKNDSWPLQIRPFSRWPPKNKIAYISMGSVCDKLINSQFLFMVEQQIWYQIEAQFLAFCVKFKYAN